MVNEKLIQKILLLFSIYFILINTFDFQNAEYTREYLVLM